MFIVCLWVSSSCLDLQVAYPSTRKKKHVHVPLQKIDFVMSFLVFCYDVGFEEVATQSFRESLTPKAEGTFKEVRTKTPVGGSAPTAPHTAWQTISPKVSWLLSKG